MPSFVTNHQTVPELGYAESTEGLNSPLTFCQVSINIMLSIISGGGGENQVLKG